MAEASRSSGARLEGVPSQTLQLHLRPFFSPADCSAIQQSCRLGRALITRAFIRRRITRFLESKQLLRLFAVDEPTQEGGMHPMAYLLGFMYVLEMAAAAEWQLWEAWLRTMRHIGGLTDTLPIRITAADVRQVTSKAAFNHQPASLKQLMLFGHKMRGRDGNPMAVTPLDQQRHGRVGGAGITVCTLEDLPADHPFRASYKLEDPVCRGKGRGRAERGTDGWMDGWMDGCGVL